MKKIIAAVALFALPLVAFADSNVTATAGTGATVDPSGTTLVATGASQTFTFGANTGYKISGVSLDGSSLGVITSYDFTGDLVDHTLHVSASKYAGGTLPYCSSPLAPGWVVSLPDGGCGGNLQILGASLTVNGVVYECDRTLYAFRNGCQIVR